ncbi:MAG: Global regulator protein family [Gammaproteobacteria bacterium]|jgi:carbon storage regulator CsrA|nr:Global regulator protein family [Gammaproteobacteria bacterium]
MLVFGRKILEAVRIGEDVTVTVLHVRGDQVRLRVTAPRRTQRSHRLKPHSHPLK